MTKILYTVDLNHRDGAYYIDTTIDGQQCASLGPIDDRWFAEQVQTAQAAAVRATIEQAVLGLAQHLKQQRRAAA